MLPSSSPVRPRFSLTLLPNTPITPTHFLCLPIPSSVSPVHSLAPYYSDIEMTTVEEGGGVGEAGGYSLSAYSQSNGGTVVEEVGETGGPRKAVTLIVKAATIDPSRIGADLFCQEFWMELYALYELGLLKVDIKAANINSEPFKRNFLGSQPPILVEPDKALTYTDNRDLESRIFHLAKEYSVPLFEKDLAVETKIENLYRVIIHSSLFLSPSCQTGFQARCSV